jgi:hypothetical protein
MTQAGHQDAGHVQSDEHDYQIAQQLMSIFDPLNAGPA